MVKTTFTTEIPEENETIVDKWDWNAVKNALDDSARKFLINQKGFEEDHKLMNGRLIISTVAILFSLYAIAYDWFHPFPESKTVLIICVILYFITIGILTLYTSFLEKGCFAAAKQLDQNGSQKASYWKFSSKQKQYSEHTYILDIELVDGKKHRKATHEQSIARYFDEKGTLLSKVFYNDLSKYCSTLSNSEEKKANNLVVNLVFRIIKNLLN